MYEHNSSNLSTMSSLSSRVLIPQKEIEKKRKPVIIYMVAPEVIHTEASEFMSLVQRLTGKSSSSFSSSSPSTKGVDGTDGAHGGMISHRKFPVRAKARLGWGEASLEENQQSTAISRASSTSFDELIYTQRYGVDYAESKSSRWLLNGGGKKESYKFIDIFSDN